MLRRTSGTSDAPAMTGCAQNSHRFSTEVLTLFSQTCFLSFFRRSLHPYNRTWSTARTRCGFQQLLTISHWRLHFSYRHDIIIVAKAKKYTCTRKTAVDCTMQQMKRRHPPTCISLECQCDSITYHFYDPHVPVMGKR